MYLTKINSDLLSPHSAFQSQTSAMHLSYSAYRIKSTRNFVVHVFSDESSCEVEIEETFLVLNSNEHGTVEMSDVR